MITITIDGKTYQVEPGGNLLQAALSRGIDLPYFCWHPALGSVGACRQCAVKQYRDENDRRGRIAMACMTPLADGARFSVDDPEAAAFRKSVIEWLMVNHPHDCPVCDEGGECHLQDVTLMSGHVYRRYRFEKRTYRNQDLGPCLTHEMNRCIACYRCVRFYQDYAGGDDLQAFASRNRVYFGRFTDGTLQSEFSGNLAEICPTGVFTDKTLRRHYARKWDLQTAPSICVHCGVGCNTTPGERYALLRRIVNRYNGEVNGYFLCDRGRFGYEFVNSEQRLLQPTVLSNGHTQPLTRAELADQLSRILAGRMKRVIGIGSPRASLESNFALRELVGAERFFAGFAPHEQRLAELVIEILDGPVPAATLRQVEEADAVLILGEDVSNTAPRLALALRQAARQAAYRAAEALDVPRWQDASVRDAAGDQRSPFFLFTTAATRLDDLVTETFHGAPENLARLGHAIAHQIDRDAPDVEGLATRSVGFVRQVAAALVAARRPLIVSGTGCSSEPVLKAAANIAWALQAAGTDARLALVTPECNSVGAALLGGRFLDEAVEAVQSGAASTVIVLENDLFRRLSPDAARTLLSAEQVIAIDHLHQPTLEAAGYRLPAATFAEGDGTLVSSEGRAQRFFQVFTRDDPVQESWRWLALCAAAAGRPQPAVEANLDALTEACAKAVPALRRITEAAPGAGFRQVGQRIPRQPHRYSGRTAQLADRTVHEAPPPDDPDSPLAFSMEGYRGQPPSPLIPHFWAPRWNSQQAVNKFQSEVGGPLAGGDPGVRLFEPGPRRPYYTRIPEAFKADRQRLRLLPIHEVFGSDELSRQAPAVAGRTPRPYLALNSKDAALRHKADGAVVSAEIDGRTFELTLRLLDSMPRGCAGVPVGLGDLVGLPPDATVTLSNSGLQ